jgi:hypothetical protein
VDWVSSLAFVLGRATTSPSRQMWSTICIPAGDNNDWGSGHHPSVVGRTCDYGMWECTRASLTLFATRFQPITTSVWEDRIPVLHRACWEVPGLGSKPGLRDHTKCTVQNLRMGLQVKRIPGKACLQDYSYIPTSSNVQTWYKTTGGRTLRYT